MLLCLVALPLTALRGTAWSDLTRTIPEIVKTVFNGRWGSSSALAKESRPESPILRPMNRVDPGAQQGRSPSRSCDAGVDAWPHRAETTTAGIHLPPFAAIPTRVPEPLPTEETMASVGPSGHARFSVRVGETTDTHRAPLVPVLRRDRALGNAAADSLPLQDAVMRPGAKPRQANEPDERFTYVLDRLRELGAVYYLLETWGNEGQRFRFHCKMAIGGNSNYTRHFEATDRDALRAMGKVLAEIETWRAGR
jgi:hypothetical protein